MITAEHLEHWLKELEYQLNGIVSEIAEAKIGTTKNILVNDKNISFEYLREKAYKIAGNVHMIREDMRLDG